MNKFFFTIIGSASVLQIANAQNLQGAITKTENERYDLAAADFRQLIIKEPAKGENYFYYGENFLKNNNPDSALIIYKKGADAQPTNALNLVGIAKVMMLQGKDADANANLFKAKTLAGKNANALVELADAYITAPVTSRNPTQAITILDEALKYDSKNAEAHILKGDALDVLHPTEGGPAIKEYEDAQKLNPKSATAVLRQGKLWNRAHNYQLALDKYKEAVNIDPNFAPAYIEQAELYHRANQDNKAVESAKKYLELNGNSGYAQGRYASFLFENKQYPDAVKTIETIQQKDTSDAYLYRLLGYAYDEMGNKTDTAAYTKGAKAIDKFFQKTNGKNFNYIAEDYRHKGSLLSKSGKDSLGVVELQKAIDLDPTKNCDLYSDIGKIWMKSKKYANAIIAYDKKPSCGKTLTGQDFYELGRAYYYGPKDFVKADTAFSGLVQSNPTYPLGYFWKAKAEVQLDQKNEKWLAKPNYEKGLELVKPEERTGTYKSYVIEASSYLGYHYFVVKDNEKAKTYWTTVKELDPNNEKAKAFFKSLAGGK